MNSAQDIASKTYQTIIAQIAAFTRELGAVESLGEWRARLNDYQQAKEHEESLHRLGQSLSV